MSRKKWLVSPYDKKLAIKLAAECDIDEFVALILTARGITEPFEIEEFLSGEFELSDPFLIPDMQKAVERIRKAIENFEKIAIYGDYDADGVCATAILYSYLTTQNANVMFYIPQRIGEGYGMNTSSIEKLSEEGVTLIVTVDNGVSAAREVELAKKLGIDVVITDHHLPPEILPNAVAVVNPHMKDSICPFKEISGSVVAYKLVCALEGCEPQELLYEYSDLAAIGTVADIMPLSGENRVIVKHGLKLIRSGERHGIDAILTQAGMAGKKLSASSIGFVIGPRINAAGRMGHSERAVKLMISTDSDESENIANELGEENARRQQVEADILMRAKESILNNRLQYDKVLVVSGEDWHSGVVGIVASRLTEHFGRPSIVLSVKDGIATGSARSISGFSIHDALNFAKQHLSVFGGHELAGGMTLPVEEIDNFRKAVNLYANSVEMPWPTLKIDCKINPQFITLDTVYALSPLEPYGKGNPTPLFGLFGMRVESIYPISNGVHTKLTLSRQSAVVTVLCFGWKTQEFAFSTGDIIDAAVALDYSDYQGQAAIKIQLKDIRLSSSNEESVLSSIRIYEAFQRNDLTDTEKLKELIPVRDEIAAVYRTIKNEKKPTIFFEVLAFRLNMDYAKLRIILDILEERNLVRLDVLSQETAGVILCEVDGKVDLEESEVLKKLKQEVMA